MRYLLVLCLLVLTCCTTAIGRGKTKTKAKRNPFTMEQLGTKPLEKEFDIEAKAITFDGKNEFKILFTVVAMTDLTRLRKALDPDEKKRDPCFYFYLLDSDRVVHLKLPPTGVEGELTGMVKDSFRIILRIPEADLPKILRIEARMEKK